MKTPRSFLPTLVLVALAFVATALCDTFVKSASSTAAASQTATATNGIATVTIAAGGTGIRNVVDGVAWSYSAAPTGGHIAIKDGSTTVFETDITAAGAGFFPALRRGTANTAMTVVLSAGGSGVVGYVNAARVYQEQ